jgi:hypothetical protein
VTRQALVLYIRTRAMVYVIVLSHANTYPPPIDTSRSTRILYPFPGVVSGSTSIFPRVHADTLLKRLPSIDGRAIWLACLRHQIATYFSFLSWPMVLGNGACYVATPIEADDLELGRCSNGGAMQCRLGRSSHRGLGGWFELLVYVMTAGWERHMGI